MSEHALALDNLVQETHFRDGETSLKARSTTSAAPEPSTQPASANAPAPKPAAKIIEFPRFAPPVPQPDQLAEPVFDRPRILEVPEVEPPAPALGGILIEAVEPKDIEKRRGIDTPLQGAPLVRRLIAAAFDGLVVIVASVLFAYIFWKVTSIQPPRFQLFGLAAGLLLTLWAAYEYLMLVYSGSTFGLRAAGLQLTCFDGSRTGRSLRRWRVLAFYLSAISLGMGYAWVFLDEDSLCWHDRITHTYLAKKS